MSIYINLVFRVVKTINKESGSRTSSKSVSLLAGKLPWIVEYREHGWTFISPVLFSSVQL